MCAFLPASRTTSRKESISLGEYHVDEDEVDDAESLPSSSNTLGGSVSKCTLFRGLSEISASASMSISVVAPMSLPMPTSAEEEDGTEMGDEPGRRGCARMVVSSMVSEVCRRMVPLPRLRVEVDAIEVVLLWVELEVDDREQ